MSNTIQAEYEQLEGIAGNFGKEADNSTAMTAQVRKNYEALKNGGWLGRGAAAFFNEMDGEILPALERFFAALEKGQSVTKEIVSQVHQAEEEAAGLFKGDGSASTGGVGAAAGAADGASGAGATGAGAASGGASGGGATGGAGGSTAGAGQSGGGDASAEKDLAKDGLKAINTARKVVSGIKDLSEIKAVKSVENLAKLGKNLGFKLGTSGVSGALATLNALDKEVSTPAALIDGAANGALSFFSLDPGKVSSLKSPAGVASAVTAVVHGVTSSLFPDAAKYTAIANDVMPDQVAGKLISNAVHTYDALIRGDTDRVIQQQQRLLNGEYGEVLRGYAMATETVGALITGDDDALNNISEAAASGKLGPVAEFGDWLGGKVYDIFN